MTIHLERPLPDASRNLPGRRSRKRPWNPKAPCHPYSVLLPVGFAMPPPLPEARCALAAPFHPCSLDCSSKRYNFCGTFPGVAPAGRYPAPCFHGARTFLPRALSGLAAAVIQPAGGREVGSGVRQVNEKRLQHSMVSRFLFLWASVSRETIPSSPNHRKNQRVEDRALRARTPIRHAKSA